jgi:putative transposase
VRDAVRIFVARYNADWLIEKNGHASPSHARAAWNQAKLSVAA